MAATFTVNIDFGLDNRFDAGGEWDQLLQSSQTDSVFLKAAWLRAWANSIGRSTKIIVASVRNHGVLVAAATFVEDRGVVEFAGKGPSDYSDILISSKLDDADAKVALEKLLSATRTKVGRFRHFLLTRIPEESRTLSIIAELAPQFIVFPTKIVVAPTMEMVAAKTALRKKSLRRHERGLERMGNLVVETYSTEEKIEPLLDLFFEQHIERWRHTNSPSLFLDNRNRSFYRNVVRNLDDTGCLRFTTVSLDGRIIAAHFGFYYAGRFTWYKPTFDPALSRRSPGEVLLKKLIEQAMVDGAVEFDFTIGNESFKQRFATKNRNIMSIQVTDSKLRAVIGKAANQRSRYAKAIRRRIDRT